MYIETNSIDNLKIDILGGCGYGWISAKHIDNECERLTLYYRKLKLASVEIDFNGQIIEVDFKEGSINPITPFRDIIMKYMHNIERVKIYATQLNVKNKIAF